MTAFAAVLAFRVFRHAASLKLERFAGPTALHPAFRVFRHAASLKLAIARLQIRHRGRLPRVPTRGLIEAFLLWAIALGCECLPRVPTRGLIEARRITNGLLSKPRPFRVFRHAASLKRVDAEGREVGRLDLPRVPTRGLIEA